MRSQPSFASTYAKVILERLLVDNTTRLATLVWRDLRDSAKNRFAERILTSFSIEEALARFGEKILRLLIVEVQ